MLKIIYHILFIHDCFEHFYPSTHPWVFICWGLAQHNPKAHHTVGPQLTERVVVVQCLVDHVLSNVSVFVVFSILVTVFQYFLFHFIHIGRGIHLPVADDGPVPP